MEPRHNSFLSAGRKKKRSPVAAIFFGMLLIFFAMGTLSMIFTEDGQSDPTVTGKGAVHTASVNASPDTSLAIAAKSADRMWDGPVLYHRPGDQPIDMILVEKSEQRLHLYRYDGRYRRIVSYFCATGEKKGKKRREKDEKTPEGIYFNDRTFRDRKITVFGDRAFGLTYPDVFDDLAGNGGSGIFIHGSNRKVAPYSTNGCLVMDNGDIADLDRRVDLKKIPVIIGERLPYRFEKPRRDLSELIPFIQQALVPQEYAGRPFTVSALTVWSFEDRVVAVGRLRIGANTQILGVSRLYLAGPGSTFLVMLKREWHQEKQRFVATQGPSTPQPPAAKATPAALERVGEKQQLSDRLQSWRQAWQDKRLGDYISHYHPGFSNKGRSLAEWKAYKGRLNQRNRKIAVKIRDIRYRIEKRRARAYFRQHYRSDTFSSSCYKILEFRKIGGNWKIYREDSFAGKPAGWPA